MAKGVVLSPVVARKVRRLIDRDGEGNGRASVQGVALDFADRAFPFMVRWSEKLQKWICFIPSASLVYIGEDRFSLKTSDLTEAGSPYPSGWYAVSGLSGSNGVVHLNFWKKTDDKTETSLTCSLTGSQGEDRDDYKRYTIELADVRRHSDGKRIVTQLINSAIFIGGAGKKLRGGQYTNLVVDDSDPEYTTVDVFYQ